MTQFIQDDPKYKVFKVVDTQYAQDDDSKSYEVAVNLMQAHPHAHYAHTPTTRWRAAKCYTT
jgi:ABC-type sugar transport system substrate-binding protein